MTIDVTAIAWGIAVTGFIGCIAYMAYEFKTAPLIEDEPFVGENVEADQ